MHHKFVDLHAPRYLKNINIFHIISRHSYDSYSSPWILPFKLLISYFTHRKHDTHETLYGVSWNNRNNKYVICFTNHTNIIPNHHRLDVMVVLLSACCNSMSKHEVLASAITSNSTVCSTAYVRPTLAQTEKYTYYCAICVANSPVIEGFPIQRGSNVESVPCHDVLMCFGCCSRR